MAQVEKDALTGTDTTGHEWDGIKELNTPLPKWWLYTLFATIIWAIGYWVVYPSWPMANDYLKGVWGYSSRMAHDADLAEQAKGRAEWTDKLTGQSLDEIWADTDLRNYAIAGGQFIFNENCAPCHGAGGQGQLNFPTLADDDWIWGGGLDEIFETIRVGIRSTHDDTRFAEMPAFGADELLTPEQISVVADYVLDL
ncbi:MAG: cytochrome-c oxidase, cbb3-type subunit III, partial [Magnetospiraceae bacterium]